MLNFGGVQTNKPPIFWVPNVRNSRGFFSGKERFLQSTATLGCAEGYEASGGFASFTCHLVFFESSDLNGFRVGFRAEQLAVSI